VAAHHQIQEFSEVRAITCCEAIPGDRCGRRNFPARRGAV